MEHCHYHYHTHYQNMEHSMAESIAGSLSAEGSTLLTYITSLDLPSGEGRGRYLEAFF